MNTERDDVCAICITYHPDGSFPARVAAVMPQVERLIIVDNGSSATELRMLQQLAELKGVYLILNHQNLGVATALNIGIDQALRLGFGWALLLDQDTEVFSELVPSLLRVRHSHPRRDRVAMVGAGYDEPGSAADMAGEPEWIETEYIITSGTLLDLAAYESIGRFRDDFFVDYVDLEYCARTHAEGFLVIKTRRPLMSHRIGNPQMHRWFGRTRWVKNHSPDRRYYQARNDTVMLRESPKFPHWRLKSLARSVRACRRILLFEEQKMAKMTAVLQGWLDAMRGRMGPRNRAASLAGSDGSSRPQSSDSQLL